MSRCSLSFHDYGFGCLGRATARPPTNLGYIRVLELLSKKPKRLNQLSDTIFLLVFADAHGFKDKDLIWLLSIGISLSKCICSVRIYQSLFWTICRRLNYLLWWKLTTEWRRSSVTERKLNKPVNLSRKDDFSSGMSLEPWAAAKKL